MRALAHQVVYPPHLRIASAVMDHAVTKLIRAEGPQNTFIGFKSESVFEKSQSFATFCHSLCVNPKRG
jgi:hypothetical protein